MLNVRLDKEAEKKLAEYSQEHDISKSQVVKEAVVMYFSRRDIEATPYELGKDLFGKADGGEPDMSATFKQRLKSKFSVKNAH